MDRMIIRMRTRRLGSWCLCCALVLGAAGGCGDDSGGNGNDNNNAVQPACQGHDECASDEVCDPTLHQCVPNQCGDGVMRGGEACDDGAGNSDTTPGACRTDCQPARCGDGVLDDPETCDGTDFGGASCETETGFVNGELRCADACSLDTSQCHTCGNAAIDGPERCDGTRLDGRTCEGLGYAGGLLGCSEDCLDLDERGCFSCGDELCEHDKGETSAICPEDCAWTRVEVGGGSACGIKADGTLWCWGSGLAGQLGVGTLESSSTPLRVPILAAVSELSVGANTTCAVQADHRLFCWGWNIAGQLGDGSTINSTIPVEAWLDLPVLRASTGGATTCAVLQGTGAVQTACWGWNSGMLGVGVSGDSLVPLVLDDGFDRVSVGLTHVCGRMASSGQAYCWGQNGSGQLGDGTGAGSSVPVQVAPANGGLGVAHVSAGAEFACGLDDQGHAMCWGSNAQGRLGDGTQTSRDLPTPVIGITQTVTQVDAGHSHACAVDQAGALFCWGDNYRGELGDGTQTSHSTPLQVTLPAAVAWVSAGKETTCAVLVSGAAYCWGYNNYGQVGIGEGAGEAVLQPQLVVDPYQ